MGYNYGRLIDHIHIVVKDLEKSRKFYKSILNAIGRDLTYESTEAFESDELFISRCQNNAHCSKVHLAFQVPDIKSVHKFYEVALQVGGTDNGEPGERDYHPSYYGAFVFDPDGNNIEAVFHGPTQRSTESVEMKRL